MPHMYDELAAWWPLVSHPSEYEEEAAIYWRLLADACVHPIHTLLELGSGGGNNASHLKARATLTLVEPATGMREVSRALNPECEHVAGDMRTVRLGRTFDAVFVHDAVCYMTTEADLLGAMTTASVHCAPGGAVLFAPDYVRETFEPGTESGGRDEGTRGLRFLEWMWDPDPIDTTYTVDYAFLLREADGSVRAVHDRHIEGLFSRADWLRWLAEAGFVDARRVPFEHSEVEPGAHDVFVGRKD
jgi:SAM-dependent methyltransferase